MEIHNTHNPDDAFCLYCQQQYTSVTRLVTHVKRKHPGTYAHQAILDQEQSEMLNQIDKDF
jgi:hypothetical protein